MPAFKIYAFEVLQLLTIKFSSYLTKIDETTDLVDGVGG
jgi:hypothetical protein